MTGDMSVDLGGIPETMLWTLHNRASEAARPDAILRDEAAVRIYRSIPYDYERSFGKPDGSHAARSRIFDDALRPWLAEHPGATVVELGAGLETQFRRVDDGSVRWLCVDVPEALACANVSCPRLSAAGTSRSVRSTQHGSTPSIRHEGCS